MKKIDALIWKMISVIGLLAATWLVLFLGGGLIFMVWSVLNIGGVV